MAAQLIMRKRGAKLEPASALDAEILAEAPDGDVVVTVQRAKDDRSVKQNNLRWKVCSLIAENTEGWTKDGVNDALKIETGHVTYSRAPDGTFWRFAKPTDFGAIGSAEFSAWLDKAFMAAGELFGPGLAAGVWNEIAALIEGTVEAADQLANAAGRAA